MLNSSEIANLADQHAMDAGEIEAGIGDFEVFFKALDSSGINTAAFLEASAQITGAARATARGAVSIIEEQAESVSDAHLRLSQYLCAVLEKAGDSHTRIWVSQVSWEDTSIEYIPFAAKLKPATAADLATVFDLELPEAAVMAARHALHLRYFVESGGAADHSLDPQGNPEVFAG